MHGRRVQSTVGYRLPSSPCVSVNVNRRSHPLMQGAWQLQNAQYTEDIIDHQAI